MEKIKDENAPKWYKDFMNALEKSVFDNRKVNVLEEIKKEQIECGKNGHPGSTLMFILNNSRNADYLCPTCGAIYKKYLTDEEWEEHIKKNADTL